MAVLLYRIEPSEEIFINYVVVKLIEFLRKELCIYIYIYCIRHIAIRLCPYKTAVDQNFECRVRIPLTVIQILANFEDGFYGQSICCDF